MEVGGKHCEMMRKRINVLQSKCTDIWVMTLMYAQSKSDQNVFGSAWLTNNAAKLATKLDNPKHWLLCRTQFPCQSTPKRTTF